MEQGHCQNKNDKGKSREIIIATPEDMPQYKRPVCPECGSVATSRGAEWGCPTCGKRWVKNLRRHCADCPLKNKTG